MQLDLAMISRVIGQLLKEETDKIARDDADIRARMELAEATVLVLTDQVKGWKAMLDSVYEQLEAVKKLEGPKGDTGDTGPQGEKGDTGPQGDIGPQGDTGERGEKGDTGLQGDAGGHGEKGEIGPQGEKGDTGPQGDTGEHGEKGDVGERGERGDTGPQGDTGERGEKGDTGTAGERGEKGDTGEAAKAIPPTEVQIIDGVRAIYPDIRHDLIKRLPAMTHKGTFDPEAQYDVGDEVIKNGSTFRLMRVSNDAPPSDDWQMTSMGRLGKTGKPGPQGEKGDDGKDGKDGKDGASVDFLTLEDDGQFVTVMTDGDAKSLNVDKLIELVIKKMGE